MKRFAACTLLLSFVLPAICLPLATTPAFAQRASATSSKPPTDPTALYMWCRKQIFAKYGQRDPLTKQRMLPSSRVVAMSNACVQSGGRTI